MKFFVLLTAFLCFQELAMADAASSSAAEVDCSLNVSVLKEKDGKNISKPSLDLRIVTLPLLKLSGKSAILKPAGATIGCQNNYEGQIDENTLVAACPEIKGEEPPRVSRLEIVLINPPDGMKRDYFCTPKLSTGNTSKSGNGAK